MEDNKKFGNKKKDNNNNDVEAYNDQLGENASEEFKSEEYDNALESKNKNKSLK